MRAKIAARRYCARFERILGTIEGDGYRLRLDYAEQHRALVYLKMPWIAARVSLPHVKSKVGSGVRLPATQAEE